jgi:hypothetical protein
MARSFCIQLASVVVVSSMLAILSTGCARQGKQQTKSQNVQDNQSLFTASIKAEQVTVERLDAITWEQVAPTIKDVSDSPETLEALLAVVGNSTSAPARYLGAMIRLAQGESELAHALFSGLAAAEIPDAYLYAPYRLQSTLRPTEKNPFREPIVKALAAGSLEPLIAARTSMMEGQFAQAMEYYLLTDPGQWRTLDADGLIALRHHAGLSGEAGGIARAAIRGGRLAPDTRKRLESVFVDGNTENKEAVKERFRRSIADNKSLEKAVARGAATQLRDQRDFLEKRYDSLLDRYQGGGVATLPDKTVLMLVLAAAETGRDDAFRQWARETKRRTPGPEVSIWLKSLQKDAAR